MPTTYNRVSESSNLSGSTKNEKKYNMSNDAEKTILYNILNNVNKNLSFHILSLTKEMDEESLQGVFVKKVLNWFIDEEKRLWLSRMFGRTNSAFKVNDMEFLYSLNSFIQNHFGDPHYAYHFKIVWCNNSKIEVDKTDPTGRPSIKAWLNRYDNQDNQITVGGSHNPALLIEIMDIYEQIELKSISEKKSKRSYLSKKNLKSDTVVSRKKNTKHDT